MKSRVILALFSLIFLTGCSSLILKPGDFSWPIESVSKVNEKGLIEDNQYYFSLNIKALLYDETRDSVNISNVSVRVIRNVEGLYFITAPAFKNVYVFEQAEGGLKLVRRIFISENGIEKPAFNQRPPYIQLLNGQNPPVFLTKDGILEGEDK